MNCGFSHPFGQRECVALYRSQSPINQIKSTGQTNPIWKGATHPLTYPNSLPNPFPPDF